MISIIIPTLNEEKVLADTLKNLVDGLKHTPYEIIVSDGRSTDKTREIAKSFGAKVLEYQGTKRQTIAQARNAGAAEARGDMLLFLDADITLPEPEDFLAKLTVQFSQDEKLVAMTVGLRVLPQFETTADRIIFNFMNYYSYFLNDTLRIGGAAGEFQMCRASAFKAVDGYNENLVAGEDYDFFQRLQRIGRTRVELRLLAYHSGRRAHQVGWPKLLWQWATNSLWVTFFKHSRLNEWNVIR